MKQFLFILFGMFFTALSLSLYAQEAKKEKGMMTEEVLAPTMHVVDGILYVTDAPIGAKIQIITIVGNKVREITVQERNASYVLNLPKAIYIFKLEGTVRKFVIR